MSVLAIERAVILLRYMMNNEAGLSIREVSRELGYSPATVQKLINALKTQGYVIQDETTDRYHLGPETVQLGLAALSRLEVRRVAHPHLERLSRETEETVFLAIKRGNHTVYIDKVVSDHPIRMDASLATKRPYNCTAAGKVLLAYMPNEEINRLFKEKAFESRTSHSIVDYEMLRSELEKIRTQDWVLDNEEFVYGAGCIAAPIRDHEGNVIASITVSGPLDRINSNFDNFKAQVIAHAKAISEEIGYRS